MCCFTKFFYFCVFNVTAEEKEPYEAKARVDKIRYKDEISGYKNQQAQAQPMNIDSGNESDSP
jgi:structure-specific recognition protein 1